MDNFIILFDELLEEAIKSLQMRVLLGDIYWCETNGWTINPFGNYALAH